jgi:hypothetical protein
MHSVVLLSFKKYIHVKNPASYLFYILSCPLLNSIKLKIPDIRIRNYLYVCLFLRACYAAQASLEFLVLLPQPPDRWVRRVSPCSASETCFFLK